MSEPDLLHLAAIALRIGPAVLLSPWFGGPHVPWIARCGLGLVLVVLTGPLVPVAELDFMGLFREAAMGLAALLAVGAGLWMLEGAYNTRATVRGVTTGLPALLALCTLIATGAFQQALHVLLYSFTSVPPGAEWLSLGGLTELGRFTFGIFVFFAAPYWVCHGAFDGLAHWWRTHDLGTLASAQHAIQARDLAALGLLMLWLAGADDLAMTLVWGKF